MNIPLFVYGSLMEGEELHGYLSGLTSRPARTRGSLFRLPAGYPALVQQPGNQWAKGELFTLQSMARFSVLDLLEGVNRGLYERKKIPVEWQGQTLQAWAYVMNAKQVADFGGKIIPSGDWRNVPRTTHSI